MANRFWNFVTALVPGNLAKAEDVNANLSGVETGFSDVGTELDQCLQVTNSPGTMTISLNAAARAGMVVAFDASGGIIATTEIGEWKGDHADAAGTDYAERDLVVDAAGAIKLDSIYRCNTAHTSTGDLAADAANWDLVIDMTDVKTSEAAAAASAAASAADVVSTNADVVTTNADVVSTNADVVTTNAAVANLIGQGAAASSVAPDFDINSDQTQTILALTHDPVPTLSNLAAGRSITVILVASGADRTITYDADWVQIGSLPTTIPDGKSLMLSFVSTTALDTGVIVNGGLEL